VPAAAAAGAASACSCETGRSEEIFRKAALSGTSSGGVWKQAFSSTFRVPNTTGSPTFTVISTERPVILSSARSVARSCFA